MPRSRPRSARPLAVLLLAALPAARGQDDLGWIDRAAVERGEVVTEVERDRPPLHVLVRVAALIDAPPEAIWEVLTACELAPEYVPHVQSCRLLETLDGGAAELFIQVVKPAFFLPRFEHVFRLDYDPHVRVDVSRVSGPIAFLEGRWQLLPESDGKTLLVYQLEVNPGMPVPRFWVRATMRRDLPQVVAAVRERAEAAER